GLQLLPGRLARLHFLLSPLVTARAQPPTTGKTHLPLGALQTEFRCVTGHDGVSGGRGAGLASVGVIAPRDADTAAKLTYSRSPGRRSSPSAGAGASCRRPSRTQPAAAC